MALCLLIEDRTTLLRAVVDSFAKRGAADEIRYLDHQGSLLSGYEHLLTSVDVILLDCKDLGRQQEDPTASQLACLDVLDRLEALRVTAPIYTYSMDMDRPEVNIPVREYAMVRRAFLTGDMLRHLPSLIAGTCGAEGVPRPATRDFESLQIGPAARLAVAHQRMREDPEAWELVWNPRHPTASRALRSRVSRRVGALLDADPPNIRHIVSVLGLVAGLPVVS